MRDVTAIESAWLLELAPHFYQQGTVGMNGACSPKLPANPPFVFWNMQSFSNSLPEFVPPSSAEGEMPQAILGNSTISSAYIEA